MVTGTDSENPNEVKEQRKIRRRRVGESLLGLGFKDLRLVTGGSGPILLKEQYEPYPRPSPVHFSGFVGLVSDLFFKVILT